MPSLVIRRPPHHLPQVSIAGRDNFLAVEADRAVAAVVEHAGEARVAATLLSCLAGTKSPDVRAKAAMHLDSCLQQHGARLVRCTAAGSGVNWSSALKAPCQGTRQGRHQQDVAP